LTAPDFTRVLGTSTCSAIKPDSPACSPNIITGTNPADEILVVEHGGLGGELVERFH